MNSVHNTSSTVIQRFEQQVEAFPNKIALQDKVQSVTYHELNKRANEIGHRLQETEPDPIVGTFFNHSIENIVAILGILKSGKAYLPINPRNSPETINQIITHSEISSLISSTEENHWLKEQVRMLNLNSLTNEKDTKPEIKLESNDHCCVLYTSGSSGEPKGVLQNHRNVLHTVEVYTKRWNIVADDKILLLSHSSFSGSMANLFTCLLNGVTNHLFDPAHEELVQLAETIHSQQLTVYHSVPSLFLSLLNLPSLRKGFPSIREVSLGGEAVHAQHLEKFKQYFPKAENLHVVYGAAEALGAAFFSDAAQMAYQNGHLPVGYAVEDFSIDIVDDNRQVLPKGEQGEIRIVSEFVSLGYQNDQEKTLGSFETLGRKRAYYTGDVGYMDEIGCLYYLGRNDSVVKISGQKVSLIDIEARLVAIEAIEEAAVIPHPENSSSLIAYIVTIGEMKDVEIRQHLVEHLPPHMIPAHFHRITDMPKNVNGKVDRKLLWKDEENSTPEIVSPSNALEKRLIEIWKQVLGEETIGVEDNFFDLGGNSIKAILVLARVNRSLGTSLSIRDVFYAPTIREISNFLIREWNQ